MEDLSRFTGHVGGSSRLAAYRARLNGSTPAQAGMAAALARAERSPALIDARTVPAAVAKSTPRSLPSNDQSDKVDRAAIIQNANASEGMRWTTVLASKASQGRERLAAHLLSQPQRFSAAQIIAALSSQATGGAPSRVAAASWGKAASWDDVRADVLQRTGRA